MASKQSLRIRMLTPSEPEAEEFFIEKSTERRHWSEMGLGEKAQAPTLGSLQGRYGGSPLPRTSAATRGPTPTKYSFSSVGVASGATRWVDLLPSITCRTLRKMEVGPCLLTRLVMSFLTSRRMADLTSLSSVWKARVRPSRARSPRRRAMSRRVASEAGGAEGL